jgi:hypothetical protein
MKNVIKIIKIYFYIKFINIKYYYIYIMNNNLTSDKYKLHIPLHFWFTKNTKLSAPLVHIQYEP